MGDAAITASRDMVKPREPNGLCEIALVQDPCHTFQVDRRSPGPKQSGRFSQDLSKMDKPQNMGSEFGRLVSRGEVGIVVFGLPVGQPGTGNAILLFDQYGILACTTSQSTPKGPSSSPQQLH
jgi:hypothetical protein